ncbi:hypothetical protein PISL3812_08666 [Talaromyces islandicus]|uniref:Uncharacterized protein n=1 Tax=Talaromyces islandicus TaxID=28573 RepID=A0A0U1M9M2_TALIS|nr:hypothetical protein PISL3812_08666 [Talaromyces islandicus]
MGPRKRLTEMRSAERLRNKEHRESLQVIDEDSEVKLPARPRPSLRPRHDPRNDTSIKRPPSRSGEPFRRDPSSGERIQLPSKVYFENKTLLSGAQSASTERPPSGRGISSDRRSPSLLENPSTDELLVMEKAAVAAVHDRRRENPPPREYPDQQSYDAPVWWDGFSGVSPSAFNPRPAAFSPETTPQTFFPSESVPFIGSGQVTYVGPTQYDAQITITIFWDNANVWGRFNIADGSGNGYLRSEFVPQWIPVKTLDKVKFHWRGCAGQWKVPSSVSKPWPECTKAEIEFLNEGRAIKGTMHPMAGHGNAIWHTNERGQQCIEDNMFEFRGKKQAESKEDEQAAWDGWDIFRP